MTTLSIVAGPVPTALGIGAGSAQRSAVAVTIIGGQMLCLLPTPARDAGRLLALRRGGAARPARDACAAAGAARPVFADDAVKRCHRVGGGTMPTCTEGQ